MNNNSSYFDSLMSSLPKMSSVTVDSMLTPPLKDALLSISQSYSSVALNASVQSITVAYRSVLSSLGIASATLLSECSQVLSTYSPVIEAAKTANCSLSHLSLSEQPLSVVKTVAVATKSALESSDSFDSIENSDEYMELSKPLADMVKHVDASVQLPDADKNNVVRVSKVDRNTILSVLSIIISLLMALYTFQSDKSNAKISDQQHTESLEQDQRQHEENLHQDQQQHEDIMQELQQIEENTAPNSLPQKPTSTTTQSEQ